MSTYVRIKREAAREDVCVEHRLQGVGVAAEDRVAEFEVTERHAVLVRAGDKEHGAPHLNRRPRYALEVVVVVVAVAE